MSFQFKPFKDDWLKHTDLFNRYLPSIKYTTELDVDFFEILAFDQSSLKQYRIEAARSSTKYLGNNPVLCLSGGIDSQAMIQCWIEAGIDFTVAIGVFKNDLNYQDVEYAELFCKKFNIDPVIVEIDVLMFLSRENLDFAEKYQCTSPHFNTHYKMFDKLREMQFTGVCAGGTAFARGKEDWGPAPTAPQMNYVEYSRLNQFPVIGNFLGFDPSLCWTLALLTPPHATVWTTPALTFEELTQENDKRYQAKVLGYKNHGFDIIPQSQKFTGFEKVKEYFSEKYKDGWAFEKKFRHPLEKKFGTAVGELVLTKSQQNVLDTLYRQNGFSC